VHSNLYSYPFKSYRWTRTHARQPELQAYLQETVDQFGLGPHLRLGVAVDSATWDDDRHLWTVTLGTGTVVECEVVISAVGFLNVPRYPDWPGLDSFEGPSFHTARWEHEHDLSGRTVAVVGTGSSATQVVPAIQPLVGRLYVFQREPGWVLPKGERQFTEAERRRLDRPWRRAWDRASLRLVLERGLIGAATFRPGTKLNAKRQQTCLDYIAREFADRPDLGKAVTPTYPYPGKRPVIASQFYPALRAENVELVPRAVSRVTPSGIVDADGVERPVAVIVMATGFQATDYLARVRVVGRRGASGPLGRRAPGVSGHHRARLPQLLHALRAGYQRRRAGVHARGAGRVRRSGGERDGPAPSQRRRGPALLRGLMVCVAPVQDGGYVMDHDPQLLPLAHGQDRHPVALGQPGLPRADQGPRPGLGDHPTPPGGGAVSRVTSPSRQRSAGTHRAAPDADPTVVEVQPDRPSLQRSSACP
jgi:cation diffusion facilitator CzcD-associated flavoprotein CzcO